MSECCCWVIHFLTPPLLSFFPSCSFSLSLVLLSPGLNVEGALLKFVGPMRGDHDHDHDHEDEPQQEEAKSNAPATE